MRKILLIALVAGCAKSEETPAKGERDAAPIEEPAPTGDPPIEEPPPQQTQDSGAPDAAETCTTKVVINEVMPYGEAAADEFIELYNPNGCAVALDGHKISYKSMAGVPANGAPLHAFAAGASIPAKGWFVIGTTAFK